MTSWKAIQMRIFHDSQDACLSWQGLMCVSPSPPQIHHPRQIAFLILTLNWHLAGLPVSLLFNFSSSFFTCCDVVYIPLIWEYFRQNICHVMSCCPTFRQAERRQYLSESTWRVFCCLSVVSLSLWPCLYEVNPLFMVSQYRDAPVASAFYLVLHQPPLRGLDLLNSVLRLGTRLSRTFSASSCRLCINRLVF